ncbi:hypothetical protein QVD17_00442 [Tagetes erecta]|uniref:Uncharacterized protein n=1 Tax=Tagetes erecta TaxID=13708 RepID=A0AAD8L7U6_TARER|nr:hypothetical protein QVD17_00442 [Tagetes erecta]
MRLYLMLHNIHAHYLLLGFAGKLDQAAAALLFSRHRQRARNEGGGLLLLISDDQREGREGEEIEQDVVYACVLFDAADH